MVADKAKNKKSTLSPRIWALIIFGVALLPRFFHLLSNYSSPLFNYLSPDPLFYFNIASALSNGQVIGDVVLLKTPIYPYLLALYYWIFGPALFVPLLLQAILGSFSCVMVYVIARQYYTDRVAVTAGLLTALCGTLIYFGGELLPFTLALTLNLIALWLLSKYENTRERSQIIVAGMVLGLSAAVHPAVLLFAPVVVMWLHQRLSENRQEFVRQAVPFIIGLLILLVPLAAHNLIVGGEIATFKTYAGVNLAAGSNAQTIGGTPILPGGKPDAYAGTDVAVAMANQQTGKKLETTEVGSYWLGQGLGYVVSHPLSWIGLELRKAAYLITSYEISKDRQPYFFAKRSPALRFFLWDKVVAFPLGILLPLALPAIVAGASWRRNRRQCALIGYVLAYVLMMLIFSVTSRYRGMILPVALIWSAAGLWTMIELYREHEFSKFYRWLAIVIVAVVVTNGLSYIPGLSPRVSSEFEGYVFTGNAYMNAGKLEQAEKDFMKAASLNPGSAPVLLSLGDLSARQNKDSAAVVYYQHAIAAAPEDVRPKKAVAAILKKRNRIKDLNDLVISEIKRNPNDSWALKEYAYIHTMLKEHAQAADLYERAFEADTTDYGCIFQKAGCYLEVDMRMEAAEEYRRFLKYVPNSVEARANLAQVYARQGKLDLALQEFQAVSKAQPDNPAGYFNLASTYLQLGELDKAEEMVAKAAKLDATFQGLDQVQDMITQERAKRK